MFPNGWKYLKKDGRVLWTCAETRSERNAISVSLKTEDEMAFDMSTGTRKELVIMV
jgi:hypothetical protein